MPTQQGREVHGKPRGHRAWSMALFLFPCLIGLGGGPLAAQTTPRETTGAPTAGPTQPSRTPSAPPTTGSGATGSGASGATGSGATGGSPGTPAAPVGPLEALPSSQERLLVPVPSQFNWLQRGTPSNPLLESLLSLQGPSRLNLSVSLEESISDNFAHAARKGRTDARTGATLGTVYRLEDDQKFLSLANTVRAFYQARSGDSEIGFANLALNAGYQLSQLSFGLSDNFIREDNTTRDISVSLLRSQQRRFLRNTLSPQMQYTFTPRTSATLGYTNTVVIDEEGGGGDSVSHSASAGLQHRLSPSLSGGLQYAFTASTGSAVSGLGAVTGGTDGGPTRSHNVSGNLGYQFDADTSFSLGSSVLFVSRQGRNGRDSTTYNANVGIRRALFEQVSLAASVGPTLIKREGQDSRVRINWQVNLDGPIPLFATQGLTLTLTTNQSVQDTAGEVDNVGLVLRQAVDARLTYRPTALWNAVLFANYIRTEFLEDTGTNLNTPRSRLDNATSLGVTASYALTNVISLTGAYLYQRHDARGGGTNFDENRVTLTVTGTFAVF